MLKLDNISKSFPGTFELVLKSINLELISGDFCTIIGANGSEKSTFLKLIAGEHNPSSGKIFFNDKDYTNSNQTSLIAQVVQDVNKGIIPEMTLLENRC